MLCVIYHAIGTLNDDHFRYSIESLKKQDIDYDLVLYNHSGLPDGYFYQYFDSLKPYKILNRKNNIKGAIADWKEQFDRIGGYKYYFVHKADFYLADGCLKRFTEVVFDNEPLFVGVKKFDCRETTKINTIREMAKLGSWEQAKTFGENSYSPEDEPKWDGVMHGYNDGLRGHFQPTKDELERRFGECTAFKNMGVQKITDDKIYAMHMFHELPPNEREDKKNQKGARY